MNSVMMWVLYVIARYPVWGEAWDLPTAWYSDVVAYSVASTQDCQLMNTAGGLQSAQSRFRRTSGGKGKRKRPTGPVSTETSRPLHRHLHYYAFAAVLVGIAVVVYGRPLHAAFVFDDFALPYYRRDFATDSFMAWVSSVRPLLMLSYWANFQISGRETYSYHLLNLLLHCANSAAVFLIARRILPRAGIEQPRLNILSGFASALFLLHPIQTESVDYVSGRSEVLSAFFFLYAFAIFLYKPSQAAIGWGRSVLLLSLFACALASKEHTVTLPALFLMADLFWSAEQPIAVVRRNWRLYLPILCGGLVAARLIWILVRNSSSAGFEHAGVTWLSYAQTQCRVFFLYLRLLFIPVRQNFDYDLPWSPNRFDLGAFTLLLIILALAVTAWRLRKRFPVGSFGLLVFMLLVAPTSSVIPIKDAIAERRLYLPMLGFVLVACELMIHLTREAASTMAFASAVILAASIATYQRSQVWTNEVGLWEDTVAKSPNKLRGYSHLVHGLVQSHRCREAIDHMSDLSRRVDLDGSALANWAIAYDCVNEPENALERLEQSAEKLPWPSTYINLARHQAKLNRLQDAIQSVNEALKLDPSLESAYALRAQIYFRQGDSSAAARDYARVLLKGYIDRPREGATISGKVVAGGWALAKTSAISEISIYMDDRRLVQATMGGARPDIAKLYPTQLGAENSGWNALFDTAGTPAGQHLLSIRAKLQDGTFLEVCSNRVVVSK
jgi:tetratricopeptide (TPR) repeat protein